MVLYEYNKSLKLPSTADLVTKKEFDELSAKILSGKYSSVSSQSKNLAQNSDIATLIQSLEPNMPLLLDNTLSRSNVYNELRNDVANINEEVLALKKTNSTVSVAGALPNQSDDYSTIKNVLSKTQEDFASIKLKVDSMEKSIRTNTNSTTKSPIKEDELSKLKTSLSDVQNQVVALMGRLDGFEKNTGTKTFSQENTSAATNNDQLSTIKTQISTIETSNNNKISSVQSELDIIKDRLSDFDKTQQSNQPNNYTSTAQIDKSQVDDLKRRLYKLEAENAKMASVSKDINSISAKPSLELKTEISRTQQDVAEIKRRVGAIETDATSTSKSTTTSDKSALTKLSVGLSLVAALFIAR